MSTPAQLGPADLRHRAGDVGGQRVGHGLHGDRRAVAHRHAPDIDPARLAAVDILVGAVAAHALALRVAVAPGPRLHAVPAATKAGRQGGGGVRLIELAGRSMRRLAPCRYCGPYLAQPRRDRRAGTGRGHRQAPAAACRPSTASASSGRSRRTAPEAPSAAVAVPSTRSRCRRHCRWSAPGSGGRHRPATPRRAERGSAAPARTCRAPASRHPRWRCSTIAAGSAAAAGGIVVAAAAWVGDTDWPPARRLAAAAAASVGPRRAAAAARGRSRRRRPPGRIAGGVAPIGTDPAAEPAAADLGRRAGCGGIGGGRRARPAVRVAPGTGGTVSGRQLAVAGQVVPADIGADREHHAEQHHRAGGHAAARHRGGESSIRVVRLTSPASARKRRVDLVRIKPERGRVGAQEADRIGVARQVRDAAFLQRRRGCGGGCAGRRRSSASVQPSRSRAARRSAPRAARRHRGRSSGRHHGGHHSPDLPPASICVRAARSPRPHLQSPNAGCHRRVS